MVDVDCVLVCLDRGVVIDVSLPSIPLSRLQEFGEVISDGFESLSSNFFCKWGYLTAEVAQLFEACRNYQLRVFFHESVERLSSGGMSECNAFSRKHSADKGGCSIVRMGKVCGEDWIYRSGARVHPCSTFTVK